MRILLSFVYHLTMFVIFQKTITKKKIFRKLHLPRKLLRSFQTNLNDSLIFESFEQ